MSKKKGGFVELLYKTIMPKVYGIGAAVVIIGALFKILHLTGADEMLMIGLSVEAGIFFLSAFEPPHAEPDWSKVYPELSEDYEAPAAAPRISNKQGASLTQQLDASLEKAKIGPELLDSLGKGLNNLADSAKKMGSLSDAAVATNDYANNVKKASTQLLEMNKSYDTAIKAVSSMSEASKDAGEYHSQVQKVTKNLAALNSVYEMELKDADSHVKNMNKFYESLTGAMQGLSKVGDNTAKFTTELGKLSDNLTALNKVYGSMLTAMKGGGQA
ncbi:type IX secretion system motor protein PorL/GldL [Pseudochryseolinea flava]|uniref:Gliding motility protein GldL n=1 Tax=Pseudochryseolinea flava TaxID=2059302 RepID=A0A364Y8S0_9BACT|nr:gliding motility protein GldL [Pseudochryseolinea flava]RAW03340.1 gliding motility protein GldL [Pseudochryseolinea flava]